MPPEPLQADVLGPDYRVETISLPPDSEGAVVATLVTLEAARPNGRAVLHVHGFADYFFHTEYARWWADRGYTFYAVDLRKYGRSLREHQTPHYVSDLHEYFAEIDLAWWRITQRDGHREVIVSAHSTGGLTVSLWAHERRPSELLAMVLNSPWFDMQGSAWLRSPAARVAIERLGTARPMREIPRKISDGLRSLAARRARRRVGLRPGLEAARVPTGLRRVAACGATGAHPAARRPGRARSDPGAVVGTLVLR